MISFDEIVKEEIKKVESDVQSILHAYIPQFKKCVSDSVVENVYSAYYPEKYVRRRSNGGLSDPENYTVTEGKLSLSLINETPGNSEYADSEGWDSGPITDIIESGSGYHWTNSKIYNLQPYPRPFMEQALDTFVDEYLIPTIDDFFK